MTPIARYQAYIRHHEFSNNLLVGDGEVAAWVRSHRHYGDYSMLTEDLEGAKKKKLDKVYDTVFVTKDITNWTKWNYDLIILDDYLLEINHFQLQRLIPKMKKQAKSILLVVKDDKKDKIERDFVFSEVYEFHHLNKKYYYLEGKK